MVISSCASGRRLERDFHGNGSSWDSVPRTRCGRTPRPGVRGRASFGVTACFTSAWRLGSSACRCQSVFCHCEMGVVGPGTRPGMCRPWPARQEPRCRQSRLWPAQSRGVTRVRPIDVFNACHRKREAPGNCLKADVHHFACRKVAPFLVPFRRCSGIGGGSRAPRLRDLGGRIIDDAIPRPSRNGWRWHICLGGQLRRHDGKGGE